MIKTKFLQTLYIFPFGKIIQGSEIVIYGMGKLGRVYMNQIMATGYAKVKYAVDRDFQNIKKLESISVRNPKLLIDEQDATIVVALANPYYRDDVVNELLSYGIPKERIVDSICKYGWENDHLQNIRRISCTKKEYNEIVSDVHGVERLEEINHLFKIKKVTGFGVKRIGRNEDGGYIMLNDFRGGRIAYSFGISNEISWDEEMAAHGYDVYMYDHTITELPRDNMKFHWSPIGITGRSQGDKCLRTLKEILQENGHEKEIGMILKMDVEGVEWDVLKEIESEDLLKFDQMVFEFHEIYSNDKYDLIKICLGKINSTHQAIHIHANNCSSCIWIDGKAYPETVEVSYVRRDKYVFDELVRISLPIEEDCPNTACLPEIKLNGWD